MKEKVMSLVKEIDDGKSISCRGLDKAYLARKLMNLANIPQNNYYLLLAGIGLDGNFYFDLFITGKLLNNGYFHFLRRMEKKMKSCPLIIF